MGGWKVVYLVEMLVVSKGEWMVVKMVVYSVEMLAVSKAVS